MVSLYKTALMKNCLINEDSNPNPNSRNIMCKICVLPMTALNARSEQEMQHNMDEFSSARDDLTIKEHRIYVSASTQIRVQYIIIM